MSFINICTCQRNIKKIERRVDHRSTLFSLGIIFHQLLTKEFPIVNASSLTVNFSTNKLIPQTLQLIIERLICRFPEDRYQSYDGLLNDLLRCKTDFEKTGEISAFYPGENDAPNELNFENYLYGRHKELKRINDTLQYVESYESVNPKMVIIHGPSGIGKTLLARYAIKKVNNESTLILATKADTQKTSSFQQLQDIVSQIIDFSESTNCNEELLSIIQKITTQFLPLIKTILPNITANQEINTLEQHKTNLNLSNLLIDYLQEIVKYHKVIIQLEDLQWISETTLSAILLATSYIQGDLTIISTTRQSIQKTLPVLEQLYLHLTPPSEKLIHSFNNISTQIVELGGLNVDDVSEQMGDLLSCDENNARKLATALINKTGGKPLYIQQLLVSFKDRSVLWHDPISKSWSWKLSEIENEKVTENVADLLVTKIKNLPTNTQKTLHYASLYGSTFSANIIADALNTDLISIELTLWHATQKKNYTCKTIS